MDLREKILLTLHKEIGPSAPILFDRCCSQHLHKPSTELTRDDLAAVSQYCYSTLHPSLGQTLAVNIKECILGIED